MKLSTGVITAFELALIGKYPVLLGKPGIGKTMMLYDICGNPYKYFDDKMIERLTKISPFISRKNEKITFGLHTTSLQTVPEEYMTGLPIIKRDNAVEYTKWTLNEIFATLHSLSKVNDCVVWFIDDIHRAQFNKQDYFYELLTHRSLHGYKLPDNCIIICAGNYSSEAGARRQMSAIKNRFVEIRVEPDINDWLKYYAFEKQVHPLVVSFLQVNVMSMKNYDLFSENESESPFASPRSWDNVSEYLKLIETLYNIDIYQAIRTNNTTILEKILEVVRGSVGDKAFQAFMNYINTIRNIDVDSIVKDPKKINELDFGSKFIVTHMLIESRIKYVSDILKKLKTNNLTVVKNENEQVKESLALIKEIINQLKMNDATHSLIASLFSSFKNKVSFLIENEYIRKEITKEIFPKELIRDLLTNSAR